MATSITRRSRFVGRAPRLPARSRSAFLAACLLVAGLAAADDDESIAALKERIAAATTIVEGEAGRPYTAWDGADRATIRTYTPFRVTRALKGDLSLTQMLLRQPGGEIGGVRAVGSVGAEFEQGERAIVFVGNRGVGDGSFDIRGQLDGVYRITRDAAGGDGIDIRLGADAGSYSSKEKAPGTLLTRISLERFERLAGGVSSKDLAAIRGPSSSPVPQPVAPAIPVESPPRSRAAAGWIAVFVCVTAVAIAARLRRRR